MTTGGGRAAARSFLELFALAGLAVTQPLLDVFGDAPDFFVFRGAGRSELIAFALIVAVAPALVLWAVEQVVGLLGPRPRRATHLLFVGLLVALFAMGAAKQADLATGVLLVALGLLGGGIAVLAYRRWDAVRSWVRILAVAPLLFVGLFLTTSPASALLESQDIEAAAIEPVEDPRTVVVLQFDEWPTLTLVNGDGEIDRSIYPNLAALADDGVWYRNATTAATFTTYAVPSILTGRYPETDRTAIASQYPENLFTLLGGQFDLDVIESVTRLCPENLCDDELVDQPPSAETEATTTTTAPAPTEPSTADIVRQLLTDARQTFQALVSPDPDAAGPAQTLSGSLGSAPGATTTATAAEAPVTTRGPTPAQAAADAATTTTTRPPSDPGGSGAPGLPGFGGLGFADGALPILSIDSVDDAIGSIEAGEDPTLHFLHVLLPHSPYKFLPDGQQYADNAEGLAAVMGNIVGSRGDEQAEVDLDHQRLLLQAAYTDAVIGRVTDRLKDAGLYDDAIVVVVADHGIGLSPGGVIRAATGSSGLPPDNYADLLYVPLIIKAPGIGRPGTVSDDNVSTIDIVPTIADSLGIDLPWAVDGISLGRERRDSSEKETHVVSFGGGTGGPALSVGPPLRFDGDDALAEMLARNVDTLLRDDNPAYRLFDIHDAGEIVGERVADLEVADATGAPDASVTLNNVDTYADVDLDAGDLPAFAEGNVDAPGEAPLAVAIAVNGTIAAVTPTWTTDEQAHHFEAVLVPDRFRDGDNDVTVYLVGGVEGSRTLQPLPFSTE